MAIAFDGDNKLIKLSTSTTFDFHDIHVAAQDWAVLSANMKYQNPTGASGKSPLGGGVYTDIIYALRDGWKLQANGYADDTQLTINGSLITDDSTSRVTTIGTSGDNVHWVFQVATYGTITVSGSGVTDQDKTDIEEGVWNTIKGLGVVNGVNALQ